MTDGFFSDHVRVSLRDPRDLKENYANFRLMTHAMKTGEESAYFPHIYFDSDCSQYRQLLALLVLWPRGVHFF